MEEDKKEIPANTGEEVVDTKFKKGFDPKRNLGGRPKGALNFSTKFRIFIDKLANENEISSDEVEAQLFKVAYKKAQEGDYSFYRDIFDRLYGKPVQPMEDISNDEDIKNTIEGVQELIKQGQKNESQTNGKILQDRGQADGDTTEVPPSV